MGFVALSLMVLPGLCVSNENVVIEKVSSLDISGRARSVALYKSFAYLSLMGEGLAIIDVQNPAEPRLVRQLKEGFAPIHVAIVGDIGYESDRYHGLQIVDLSEPTFPRILKRAESPSIVLYTLPVDDYLFAAAGSDGLLSYRRLESQPFVDKASQYSRVDFSRMMEIKDTTLYLADGYDAGLRIFDIADPTTPSLVSSYFSAGFCDTLTLNDNVLFMSKRQAGVIIADITAPTSPRVIGKIKLLNGAVRSLEIKDNYLVVLHSRTGISLYDISCPENPKMVDRKSTVGDPMGLALKDDLLFVAEWKRGLSVFRLCKQ